MKKKIKEKSQREKTKFPNLNPQYNLKSRQELLDFDYLDKLTDEEKAFLDKFAAEYINASFKKEDKKKKGKRRKLKNLHKTKKQRKSCYDMNNSRNRDIITRAKASGKFHYLDDVISNEQDFHDKLEEAFNGNSSSDEE